MTDEAWICIIGIGTLISIIYAVWDISPLW